MIVCHCHALTDRDIRTAAGACGGCPETVARVCGAGNACGGCRPQVELLARGANAGSRNEAEGTARTLAV